MKKKLLHKLTIKDLKKYPIWKFTNSDETDETEIVPLTKYPVKDLTFCLVGAELTLHNGQKVFGLISNMDQSNVLKADLFKTLTVLKGKTTFNLARYFDVNIKSQGPKALAKFLGLKVSNVFPIQYDISMIAIGEPAVLKSTFIEKPAKRLSRHAIMKLALSRQ